MGIAYFFSHYTVATRTFNSMHVPHVLLLSMGQCYSE